MDNELKKAIKNLKKYKNFNILDVPVKFNEMFKGRNFDVVQLHMVQNEQGKKDIVGFCGEFLWNNGKVIPLDGDSYCDDFYVLGYHEFTNNKYEISSGLDVLVGDDW